METNRCYGCMEPLESYPCPRCGYTPPAQEVGYCLQPGMILNGKYLVGKMLGQGGFGITYMGWDITLDRKVAIKEYYPAAYVRRKEKTGLLEWHTTPAAQTAMQEGKEMFLKEARKMSRANGIVQVVQVLTLFPENNTAYIVMDYVEGETLKSRMMKNGLLSWQEAKKLFLPVIEAMGEVHEAGLVHRDLSPDNLMIQPDGQVKILDLGAAKDLNINSGESSMLVAKGGFSPLEQYIQRGASGPWTDVYAMAATMYFSLTGVVPPPAVDRMVEDSVNWNLPQLTVLPPEVQLALKKAMAVRHEQRTRTMGDFARELERTPPPAAVQSVPETKPVEISRKPEASPKKKSGIRKLAVPLVLAVALAGVLLSTGFWKGIPGDTPKEQTNTGNQETTEVPAEEMVEMTAQMRSYAEAEALLADGKIAEAAIAFGKLGDYQDARERSFELWNEIAVRETISAGVWHTVGLRSDGTAVAVGNNTDGQCSVTDWSDLIAVSAGSGHTLGLKADGTVVAVGENTLAQCNVSDWRDIVAVSAAEHHSVGLRADGTVVAAGGNSENAFTAGEWSDIIAVSAGAKHTVGLRMDGTVVAAESNNGGWRKVTYLSHWKDIVAVSVGADHIVGLRADGTVVAAGSNDCGQCYVSAWEGISAVSAGYMYTTGLRSDGTVAALGNNNSSQCNVGPWTNIVSVSSGMTHTVGLRSDGTVVTAGTNEYGRCDAKNWTDIMLPGQGASAEEPAEMEKVPVGDITTHPFTLSDDTGILTVHSITSQRMSNGDVRFTIDCTAKKGCLVSFFDPPNGDLFMLLIDGTSGTRETLVFDVEDAALKKTSNITLNFCDRETLTNAFVFLDGPFVHD